MTAIGETTPVRAALTERTRQKLIAKFGAQKIRTMAKTYPKLRLYYVALWLGLPLSLIFAASEYGTARFPGQVLVELAHVTASGFAAVHMGLFMLFKSTNVLTAKAGNAPIRETVTMQTYEVTQSEMGLLLTAVLNKNAMADLRAREAFKEEAKTGYMLEKFHAEIVFLDGEGDVLPSAITVDATIIYELKPKISALSSIEGYGHAPRSDQSLTFSRFYLAGSKAADWPAPQMP